MAQQLDPSLIRILDASGKPIGVGILVTERMAATCAHVVSAAAGQPRPSEVSLDFPRLPGHPGAVARVVQWDESTDIAGLELVGDPPEGVQPARLVKTDELWGHAFRAFGFPAGYDNGVWASGRILDRDANGWLQVEDTKNTGYFVQPGFSGGPLWDEQEGAVAGMVVAADNRSGVRVAYGLPVSALEAVWPILGERAIPSNPYRGLFAFREVDAKLFFGREAFTEKLLEAVGRKTLVAVVGPSGCGKSSVVYAGLIPRLKSSTVSASQPVSAPETGGEWMIIDFRPGSRPFEALALSLLPRLEPSQSETDRLIGMNKLATALQAGDVRLPDVLERIMQKGHPAGRLLLIIDQFEELYTLCTEVEIRPPFVEALLNAAKTPGVVVLLNLRADFLGAALAYRPLTDALQDADTKMGPMNAEELQRAIAQPAALRGVSFESGLVARILEDVIDQPGALPLLEFTLTLLWDRQEQGKLAHAAYEAIGQVEGALSHYADQMYDRLNPADQELTRQVFTQLVAPGEGTRDTRRVATRAELGEGRWELVKRLADLRLVVTGQTPASEETVEVVHEALIHDWVRLRGWMEADRAFRHWQEGLRVSLQQWLDNDQDAGALLRGAPLAEAESWLAQRSGATGSQEQAYIQASIKQREAERRRERLRWLSIAGTAGLAIILIAVVTTLAATGQLNRWIYRPLRMEWVSIPAGEFLMGSLDGDPGARADEFPQHQVALSAYRIGKYEVTNRQYAQCVRAGVCRAPSTSRYLDPEYEDHPVVYINWEDANTFCQWNDSNGRLPTEAEWEMAARGTDGRTYPWGDQPPDCSRANYSDENVACTGDTRPVGSAPDGASAFGASDMAGNVWEWVADWYSESYYASSPATDPAGPEGGPFKVLRGGSWDKQEWNGRIALRVMGLPVNRNNRDGFRCARSP